MAWHAAKRSPQQLAPEWRVRGEAGMARGGRGRVWVPAAWCPEAPQPHNTARDTQMQRGRGLPSPGAAELGFSRLGFVSHFLLSGERVICSRSLEHLAASFEQEPGKGGLRSASFLRSPELS